MNRLTRFFLEEAEDCLGSLRAELERASPEVAPLHRAARRLRGSAQMARYEDVVRSALALERSLREGDPSTLAAEEVEEVRRRIEELEREVEAVRAGRATRNSSTEWPMDDQHTEQGADPVSVDISALEYRGNAALDRATSLREPLEDRLGAGEPVETILDELFDLVRLART